MKGSPKKIFFFLLSAITPWHIADLCRRAMNGAASARASRLARSCGEGIQITSDSSFSGLGNIDIGKNFVAHARFRLEAIRSYGPQVFTPHIRIGNDVTIQNDCHIGAVSTIEIGNEVLIASKVFISDHSHGKIEYADLQTPPLRRPLFSKGPIRIGNKVWIGEGVAILAGVTIGDNSIIGANAVVTTNIPANSVAAGSPARVIRTLSAGNGT